MILTCLFLLPFTKDPGVYARVSEEYDWIKSNVCNLSVNPPAYFGCGGNGPVDPSPTPPPPTPSPPTPPPPTPSPPTPSPPVNGDMTDIFVEVVLDQFPEETSWLIRDLNNENMGGVTQREYDDLPQLSTTSKTLSVPLNGAYKFILKDSFGDGFQGTLTIYLGNSADPNKVIGFFDGENAFDTFSRKRIDFVAGNSGIIGGPAPLPDNMMAVVISITLDSWPEETSWKVKDAATDSVVQGASVKPGFYEFDTPGSTVDYTVNLLKGAQYKFILKDTVGDGLEGHATLYATTAGGAVLGEYNQLVTTFSNKHVINFSTA